MADATKKKRKRKSNEAISQAGESMMPKEKMPASGCTFAGSRRNKKKQNGNMLAILAKLATRIPAHTNETKQCA